MNLSKQILTHLKIEHRGKENAIKRRDLLGYVQHFEPYLTDRELRNIYCQLPVISSEAGIFWPVRQTELWEFQAYLKKKAIPLFNRFKMVAEGHRDLMKLNDSIQWNLF